MVSQVLSTSIPIKAWIDEAYAGEGGYETEKVCQDKAPNAPALEEVDTIVKSAVQHKSEANTDTSLQAGGINVSPETQMLNQQGTLFRNPEIYCSFNAGQIINEQASTASLLGVLPSPFPGQHLDTSAAMGSEPS